MKKFILSILFVAAIFIIPLAIQSNAFAFFHDKDSSGGSEFDCQKFWESFDEGDGITIGGPRSSEHASDLSDWKFSSKKKTLGKVSGDSCDIGGVRYDTDEEREAKNGFDIVISYFPSQEEAGDKIGSLKAGEEVEVEDKNVSGDTYSMKTLKLKTLGDDPTTVGERKNFLASGNYGRTVGRVGNCVVSLTQTWYALAYQWNTGDEYGQQVRLMDGLMEGSQLGWKILSEAKDLQQFCGKNAESGQPATQKTESVSQTADKKNEQKPSIIPIFIGEWFRLAAMGIGVEMIAIEEKYGEKKLSEKEKAEIEDFKRSQEEARTRIGGTDWEKIAREANWKSIGEAKFVAWPGDQSEVYKNQPAAEYKKGGNSEFEPLLPTQILSHGDIIQVTRRATIRTPNYVIELYPRSISEKAVVEFRDGRLILKNGAVTIWKGNVGGEFIGNQYGYGEEVIKGLNGIEIQTPVLDVTDVQTQYTVAHDEKENKSYVVVSEGQVKVTPLGSNKSIIVSPNGDKPGVVMVKQKLSITKLALAGLVLVVAIGGAVQMLKRKFTPKGSNRRKK